MAAIDTSVLDQIPGAGGLLRVVLRQEPVEGEPVWVTLTVLLETEWVLRRLLDRPRVQILELLAAPPGCRT